MKGKDYKDYKIEDFLQDKFFRNWVRNPDTQSDSFWRSWIENHSKQAPIIAMAKEIILSINIEHYKSIAPTQEEFEDVFHNILEDKHSQYEGDKYHLKEKRKFYWLKIAAGCLLISLVGYSLLQTFFDRSNEVIKNELVVVKDNPKGQKSTIGLEDGSIVRLNANSKIIYPATFDKENREVELIGEAFFEISKDVNRPFTVITGELRTTAIGTSFNIRVDDMSSHVSVSLLTGKVVVENFLEGLSLELNPMEMATFNKRRNEITKKKFFYEQEIGWKDGILVFKEADLSQIVEKLENWYDVEIKIEEEVNLETRFNGKFDNNSLAYILKALAFTSDFDFEINGNSVSLRNKIK